MTDFPLWMEKSVCFGAATTWGRPFVEARVASASEVNCYL